MAILTTARGFRYPENNMDPDINRDLGNLANDIDGQYVESTAALRPASGKVGRRHRATDTGQESLDIGTAWVVVGSFRSVLNSLPGGLNGQEVLYQTASMAAAGVGPWTIRYDSSLVGASKWKVINADDWRIFDDSQSSWSVTSYNPDSTMSITAPVSGTYDIAISAIIRPALIAGATGYMSYSVGSVAAVDADALKVSTPSATALMHVSSSRLPRPKTIAAGDSVVVSHKTSGGGADFFSRVMSLRPVRLG